MNTTARGRRLIHAVFAMLVVAAASCAGATIWLTHPGGGTGTQQAVTVQPVATSGGLPWG
jgi:hypothetical protein